MSIAKLPKMEHKLTFISFDLCYTAAVRLELIWISSVYKGLVLFNLGGKIDNYFHHGELIQPAIRSVFLWLCNRL